MTDKMKPNSLREVYVLFVDGLPALNGPSKEFWKSMFAVMTEEECVAVMGVLFDQSVEFIERAKVEVRDNPKVKGEFSAMERQAKALLEEINVSLISLHMNPLK